MATEPSEDDIGNFISFTSLSREKAVLFLKANSLNLEKAINAYFENPDGVPSEPQDDWTSFNTPSYSQDAQSVPTFHIENSDTHPGHAYSVAPSRPPSRMNVSETLSDRKYEGVGQDSAGAAEAPRQNLTTAQLEERDLQQAVAMSLGQDYGKQESGVITQAQDARFGPATQDYYDETNWGMTVVNSGTREEIISPDPEDRQRKDDEPAFLRPSQEALYIGGFLTILHSIPLAREALLLREKTAIDYGYDSQWWNGQSIKIPRIVSLDNPYADDQDWDDILYEAQRLMAFLDGTRRAFGSTDALAGLRSLYGYSGDGGVERFLEAWQEASVRATPANQLSMVFSSCAMKQEMSEMDSPNQKDFYVLNTYVESGQGQTLYDVLDDAIWPDAPGEELDDVWLDHVGEILTIKLESYGSEAMNVKIPCTFYPDRYMEARRDTVCELRLKRLDAIQKINRIESIAARYRCTGTASRAGMSNQELLEKAAQAVTVALPRHLPEGTIEFDDAKAQQVAEQLRGIAGLIKEKVDELEAEKQAARDTLREQSKILTESAVASDDPPYFKYTLRGFCTAPHITYILRKDAPIQGEEDLIEMEVNTPEEWHWWRISFSTDDAKTQQAAKPENRRGKSNKTNNADVIGYTAVKIREIEALRAARESRSLLLVYANNNAVDFPLNPAQPPLQLIRAREQEFVNTDNITFQAELDAAAHIYKGEEGPGESGDAIMEDWPKIEAEDEVTPAATENAPRVNVFDYEVDAFDEDGSHQVQEMQEMQEREGKSLLH
uniref:UBA and UBX domain-containing protein n=1 Tax=Talaromyces marneffei PM1 TaxID=1077442 RepID=A0A093UU67_TALMA